MSEESNKEGQEEPHLAEPDNSGTTPTQLKGELSNELMRLPDEKTEEGLPRGLVSALELERLPTKVLNVFGAWVAKELETRQTRADKLQDDLTQEKIDHARTDQTLKSGLTQSGAQLFSATLGGTLLGIGLGAFDFGTGYGRVSLSVIGLAMILFGCLPTALARWRSRGKSKSS